MAEINTPAPPGGAIVYIASRYCPACRNQTFAVDLNLLRHANQYTCHECGYVWSVGVAVEVQALLPVMTAEEKQTYEQQFRDADTD